MICPNCLSQMNKIDVTNRLRESFFCSRCNRVYEGVVIPTVAHSGLEKIEPLTNYPIGYIESGVECITGIGSPNNFEIMNKLNEVIEKVNLIMEVMNKGW